MGKLDGRVALISGGARGLGASAAWLHLDVTSEADWEAAVAATTARFGHLDVLVNNAGTAEGAPLWETSLDSYRRVIEVNQVGVFLGMRAVVAVMTEAGRGSIINISSMDGLVGSPRIISYIASKWAVRGMTKAAAMELAPRNIRVNSIHPGHVHTLLASTPGQDRAQVREMMEAATRRHAPMGRVGEASEIAAMAVFLASDDSSYSTGSEFVADGGFTAGYPSPGSPNPF